MRNITLIGTAHDPNGRCNDEELFRILHSIKPDVIFEEIRPSDFDFFYEAKSTLECKSVIKYRQHKIPIQVPVDRYETPKELIPEFKERLGAIFDYVECKSRECCQVKDNIDINTGRFGFKYINSFDHAQKWERICAIQDEVIFESGNQNWVHLLKTFREQMHQRNIEMVGNIYEYCENNMFEIGVYIVGASHKMGLVNEINRRSNITSELIHWNYF